MDPPSGRRWGVRSRSDLLPHVERLAIDNGDVFVWAPFDRIKRLTTARRAVFRYAISGHDYSPTRSSGVARGIPANDMLVTLGSFCPEPVECSGTVLQQAGTLMHELGHTLGLRHGGDTDELFRDGYRSVMNYEFQLSHVDYSRGLPFFDWRAIRFGAGLAAAGAAAPAATARSEEISVAELTRLVRRTATDRRRPTVRLRRTGRARVLATASDSARLDRLLVVVGGRTRQATARAGARRRARLALRLRPGRHRVAALALDAAGNRSTMRVLRVRVPRAG
jgi:hypothetical protein